MPDLGSGLLGCYRCGYVWRLRKSPVRMCPRCKSREWSQPRAPRPDLGRRFKGAGIPEIVGPRRDELLAIAEKFGATDLRVFGSVARRQARRRSDLDLLVRFDRPVGLLARAEFKERVSRLLGRPVDLTTEQSLHWLIRPQVLAEAVEL
jgi:uncharacterized protein